MGRGRVEWFGDVEGFEVGPEGVCKILGQDTGSRLLAKHETAIYFSMRDRDPGLRLWPAHLLPEPSYMQLRRCMPTYFIRFGRCHRQGGTCVRANLRIGSLLPGPLNLRK